MEQKNLFNKILDESIKEKILVEIYDDAANTDKFKVGYVIKRFEDSILLYVFNKYGQYNGYILAPIEDIYKIGKTIYNDNLDITYSEPPFPLHKKLMDNINNKTNGISAIIEFCFNNKILLKTYYSVGNAISGYIKEIDNDYICIDSYFNDGSFEGSYVVKVSNISQIDFESENEKKTERLIKKINK
jgi:hypothetical protein